MMKALEGLKAAELTTEPLPPLRIIFQPRFWGSLESRWEKGKAHLAPAILRGWDTADHFLCGRTNSDEDDSQGEIMPGAPLPGYICKQCRQIALKRGYGDKP